MSMKLRLSTNRRCVAAIKTLTRTRAKLGGWRLAALIAPAVLLATLAAPIAAQLAVSPTTIYAADGSVHIFDAEIADTPASRQQGLMFREELRADRAMLFRFDQPHEAGFWMRNTLISLDIIFITAEGVIHKIHHEARPLDETSLRSDGLVQYVLEIQGGLAKKLGVAEGDRVASPAMSPLWDGRSGG